MPTSLTMNYSNLTREFPIISDQLSAPALNVVLRELAAVLDQQVAGAVVELGCYVGTSSLFIRRLLNQAQRNTGQVRQLHVYDSFVGLPPKTKEDQSGVGLQFQQGELQISKKQLLAEFRRANLQPPIIHKGWFENLTDKEVPEQIAFAFLDGDFYKSILTSLELVWPRLMPRGRVTIDDYDQEALPGVSRAVEKFFNGSGFTIHHEQHIAIIKKAAV